MQAETEKSKSVKTVCTECGTRISAALTAGVLGCPACYRAFFAALYPLTKKEGEGQDLSAAKRERK